MSIHLRDLTHHFGENLVVNKVTLEIMDGELFVLLGGSGSGKSTILRLIAGLIEPDAGQIDLNGRDVTFLPPQARGTGFVFQNYSIFRHMTVFENIEFGLRIRKLPPAERRRRSEELLDLVGLAGLGTRYADQLSGGQQQRVALARALAYQPAVLLLDEPFGALDVKIRAQLRQSLKEIQRQLRVTTILVTHDQEEAFELADRIGVIDHGRIVEIGHPEDLYHRPRSEFAATFVGGGNVLVGREDGGAIRLGSIRLPFPQNAPAHDASAPVRVLFRPETVLVQATPFADDAATMGVAALGEGQVVERIFVGAFERIVLEMPGLRGARPLAPLPVYGQRSPRIEAVKPSQSAASDSAPEAQEDTFAPGKTFWVSLSSVHVLQPTGLKVLIYTGSEAREDSPDVQAATDFGCRLAQAARGPATLLTVVAAADEVASAQERLEALRQRLLPHIPRLETRVRRGASDAELLREVHENFYEVVVLGRSHADVALARFQAAGRGATHSPMLFQSDTPMLFVHAPRPSIERLLICTAAGEPGKSDVRFGGRVALRTQAQATVLHVRRPGATPEERTRVERHLRQAQASLETLGVTSQAKLEEGATPLDGILREAEAGDYDLIVIGAPAPRAPQQLFWSDLATQIINSTTRPVMVVPMVE
jgi:sulfate transport system ATP-binding protein